MYFRHKKSKIILILIIFFVFIHGIIYLIPLSSPADSRPDRPFENSQFASIDGIDIHYRTWMPEQPSQDPVIFIHGFGGSTFSWRYNIDSLIANGFPVVALDLPAFGYSSRKTGLIHSQENRSEWVFGLLDNLLSKEVIKLSDGYHLVGHSMGGGVITGMALSRPGEVQSLTYVAGSVFNDPPRMRRLLAYPPLKRTIGILAEHIFFTEDRLKDVLSSAYGEEIEPEVLKGYLEPLTLSGTGRAWGDLVTTSTGFQENDVATISAPALLIWGNEDTWVPLDTEPQLADALQNAELTVIDDSAHNPMETDSKTFNRQLLRFLLRRD